MKFLIVGMGSIGRRHMRNLISLGERDIIFLRTQSSTLPNDDLPSYPTETILENALAHEPDAVIVSNPTSLHLEVAIPAARVGCHLLLEKPLSDSLDRVSELTNIIDKTGCKVLMGFQFRYHLGLNQVQNLVSEGKIGRVLSARAHWGEYLPDWHPWEDYRISYSAQESLGGGVILTLCHPLDYLRWLIGEVESLWAFSGKLGDLDLAVEDTAEIGLKFSNGALGSLHLSYNQKPTTHCLEIVGTAGTIRWDNESGLTSIYQAEVGEWRHASLPDGYERNDLFLAQMRNFLAVLHGDEEPACTLEDGIKALELAVAVKKSAASGQLFAL